MEPSSGLLRSVLIATGSESTRRMYAEYCTWRGVHAREVRGAAEALREVAARLPDGAVIDERLPDGTGLDLVRALRRARHTFDLALILLTANTFATDLRDLSKHGCDRVLTVPVLPDELLGALDDVVKERAVGRPARRFESWLFLRGGESVWMVRTAPLELTVAGPRRRRAAFRFDADRDLVAFQADYRQRLEQSGFVLHAFGADRRSGRERRREPRSGGDRRAIQ